MRFLRVTVSSDDTEAVPGCWYPLETDASGNFTVTGLPAGPLRVQALHPRRGDVDLGSVNAPAEGVVLRLPD
jgi:hypothetical protein